jgi:hypothetical protein
MSRLGRLAATIACGAICALYRKGYLNTYTVAGTFKEKLALVDLIYNNGPWAKTLQDVPVWDTIESDFLFSTASGSAGTRCGWLSIGLGKTKTVQCSKFLIRSHHFVAISTRYHKYTNARTGPSMTLVNLTRMNTRTRSTMPFGPLCPTLISQCG